MKAIFLTASLCCSVYTTNASIPSNLTKVEYYTNIFSWNEAYDICNRSGGSLLQPETRLEWDYYRSVIRELSVMAVSREHFDVWLGMILVYPGEASVVWVDGCLPVCHHQFPGGEPNNLSTDFCMRVVYQRRTTTSDVFEWRTTPCDNKDREPGFICTQDMGVPCTYQEHLKTTLTMNSSSVDSEVFDTSQRDCSQLCTSRTWSGLECWTFTYNSGRGECTLYYHSNPFFLAKIETTKDRHSVLMTKTCFQMEIRSDVLPLLHGNKTPSSPCFESPVSPRCLATTRDPPTIDGTSTPLSTTAYSLSVTSSHTVVPGNKASITGKSQTDMTSVSMTRAGLPTGTSDVPTTMGVFSIPTAEDNKPATSATIVRIPLLLPQGPASPNSVATKEATATAETASTTETTEITTATATKEIATSTAATQTATTTATMESATTTTTTTETAATTATTKTTITSATPTSTSVTTALRTTPPKTNSSRQLCSCPCVQHPIRPQIITKAKFTDNLIAKLEINKTNLSSTRRKLISVYESRVVPMALGTCGLGILLSIYGVILLSDIVPHFKKLTVKALSDNK